MYCRACKYDLRGQVEFRCPECGTEFDPTDSQTWLLEIPSTKSRILGYLKPPACLAICVLWAFVVAVFFLPSGLSRGGPMRPQRRAMWVIHETWKKQVAEQPEHTDFDLVFAKAHSHPSLDAKSEGALRDRCYQWKNHLENLTLLANWLVFWCPVPIFLTHRKLRVALVGLLIASLLTFGSLLFFPGLILRTVVPHSYHFFDDYVYVKGLDWNAPNVQQRNIIIAYERIPTYPQCRQVLLMDGIGSVHESCIPHLLAAQRNGDPEPIENHPCGPDSNCDEDVATDRKVRPGQAQPPVRPKSAPGN